MYRALFASIDDPIEIRKTSGDLVERNHAAERLGFPDDDARRRCIEAQAPMRVDFGERTLELAPFTLDADHVALRIRDITALARAEEVLSEQHRVREALEHVERARAETDRFTHMLSHDLQEPLRIVGMYAQLLERRSADALDDTAQHHLRTVLANIRRMHELIDDLLALSRIDRDPFEPERIDLQRIVEDIVPTLGEPARDAHIRWRGLPAMTGSPPLLTQVFRRLLTNALMYRGEAPPEVRITAARRGSWWSIEVADNGIGIDPAFHEAVFEPFKRLHSYEAHPGTGIGLAICKRAVARHGGSIALESEPGAGTRVRIELPAD